MSIGMFGALIYIVSVGWLVYSLIRKQSTEKPLLAMIASFILFIVGVLLL